MNQPPLSPKGGFWLGNSKQKMSSKPFPFWGLFYFLSACLAFRFRFLRPGIKKYRKKYLRRSLQNKYAALFPSIFFLHKMCLVFKDSSPAVVLHKHLYGIVHLVRHAIFCTFYTHLPHVTLASSPKVTHSLRFFLYRFFLCQFNIIIIDDINVF